MSISTEKDQQKEKLESVRSDNTIVTPIYNGKPQPDCTIVEAVINLPDHKPTTWSFIYHDK